MAGISLKSLKEGIKKCDANIVIFEDAIKKERSTQEDYRKIISSPVNESGFNIESLKEGIKKCDATIGIFEVAIKKERATQEDFRFMMEAATLNEEKRKVVANGVHVEAE